MAVEGKEKNFFKIENINLMFGPINVIQYCVNMFDMPTLEELEKNI